MPFTYKLRGYVPPYAGNYGKAIVEVTTSGTYASAVLRPTNLLATVRNGIGPVSLRLSDIRSVDGEPGKGGMKVGAPNQTVRFGPVTGVTHSGTTATVTVGTGHNIQTGEAIEIRQVIGSTEMNAAWGPKVTTTGAPVVRRVSSTVFTVAGVTSITAFSTSANSIVEVKRPFAAFTLSAFTTATNLFTSTAAHNLAKGDQIYISEATGLTGAPWLDRLSIVNEVPSTTTFKVQAAGTTTGTISGGVVIPVRAANNCGTLRVLAQRAINISSITAANPAVFTTIQNHGLAIGDMVYVGGILGTSLATLNSGYVRVRTIPLATTFTLEDLAGLPISGAGATITANTGVVTAQDAEFVGTVLRETFNLDFDLLANNPSDDVYVGPFNA